MCGVRKNVWFLLLTMLIVFCSGFGNLDLPVEPDAPATDTRRSPPKDPPEGASGNLPTFFGKKLVSENDTIIYVVDISGSMWGDPKLYTGFDGDTREGYKIDRAKAELARSIFSLPPNFRFNVVAYDCITYMWEVQMQPADEEHKASAVAWCMVLTPAGATGTGPACVQALVEKDNKLVVLLTDGDPNCALGNKSEDREAHREVIKFANTQRAIVNVFGIGAYAEFKKFCMDVASDNNGQYIDIP